MPCENDEEDYEAVNTTASDNYMPKDIIQIEDISRETTISQILNFKRHISGATPKRPQLASGNTTLRGAKHEQRGELARS